MHFALSHSLPAIRKLAAAAATGVPVNSTAPAASGIQTVGQNLNTSAGVWTQSPTGFAYKWQSASDGVGTGAADIAGQTASSLALAGGQSGKYIRSGVLASNGFGAAAGYVYSAWIGPIAAALSISGTPGATGTTGGAYSFTPSASGGHTAYGFSLSGTIGASGLSFNTGTGALTATTLGPAGTYGPFNITVTDADGLTASTGAFSITVSAGAGAAGQLDFSNASNSGLLALLEDI